MSGCILYIFLLVFVSISNLSKAQELIEIAIHPNEGLYIHPVEILEFFQT